MTLPRSSTGCPYLILAPMEGVGDRSFRTAMASIGGFDEAVRDFLRVPLNPHIKSLALQYDAEELSPIPLAAQLMGSEESLMAQMAYEMQERGAPRVDLNCGCPSNTVTGKGAGSSLLKEPDKLYKIARAMVLAVSIPVTVKLRSGFEDTTLFRENLLAAQESGIAYLTLHPRTKVEGYAPPAHWNLIREAKELLKIPVVGNGDIVTVADALRIQKETSCDALMIGRGAIMNPFLFHQIRAHYAGHEFVVEERALIAYFQTYLMELGESCQKMRINKMKQLLSYFFKGSPYRQELLRLQPESAEELLDQALLYNASSHSVVEECAALC